MKRLLAIVFTVALFVQFSSVFAFAQTPLSPTPSTTYTLLPERTNADVPQNYTTHTQVVLIELIAAISCQLTGVDPVNPNSKCLGVDSKTNKIGFVDNGGGLIQFAGNMVAMTYNIPISSGHYTGYIASNFGVAKHAYAQEDTVLSSLEPVLGIWVQFRNLVYVLFVIIFMFIGFGIVFRFNIDARTVMTIQNQIPKAIVTLILVTFSFAIIGFFIDIMYLVMYFGFELLSTIKGVHLWDISPSNLQNSTPFGALGPFGGITGLSKNVGSSFGDALEPIVETIFKGVIGSLFGWIPGGGSVGGLVGNGLGWLAGNAVNALASVIATIIVAIAVLWALMRLWFILIKAYLFILIDTVVGPIWIAGSLIPGSPLNASAWFKHFFKYIAVFPLTFFMYGLGAVFVQVFSSYGAKHVTYFTPPFIGTQINPTHFGSIIGLAVILMTPEVVNMVQDVLKAPQLKYQAAIGQALGTGQNLVSGGAKPYISRAWSTDAEGRATGWINRRWKQRTEGQRIAQATAPTKAGRFKQVFGKIADPIISKTPHRVSPEEQLNQEVSAYDRADELLRRRGLDPAPAPEHIQRARARRQEEQARIQRAQVQGQQEEQQEQENNDQRDNNQPQQNLPHGNVEAANAQTQNTQEVEDQRLREELERFRAENQARIRRGEPILPIPQHLQEWENRQNQNNGGEGNNIT